MKSDQTPSLKSPSQSCSRSSEIIAKVRRYNRWRRGKEDWEDLDPEDVGKMLDTICDELQAVSAHLEIARIQLDDVVKERGELRKAIKSVKPAIEWYVAEWDRSGQPKANWPSELRRAAKTLKIIPENAKAQATQPAPQMPESKNELERG